MARRLVVLFLVLATARLAAAEKVTWSETATLKTKTIRDGRGEVVYQANYDKKSGKVVGSILDRRPAPSSKKESGDSVFVPAFRVGSHGPVLVADTLVKIEILDSLTTRRRPKGGKKVRNQKGQGFRFRVRSSLTHGGRTVVAAGTEGRGRISSLTRRGRFGRSGQLGLRFGSIRCAGGEKVPLVISKRAAEYNAKQGYAAGASIGGAMLLGPIGLAGGAFVKGRDVTIPAGSVLWVAVEGDVPLRP